MARVTRSRRINIDEDHTAITTQEPSLDITAESQPLFEINNCEEGNTMASSDGPSIPTKVKQLKAAYREAISSGTRGRKARNKKKGQQEEGQQGAAVAEGCPGENEENAPGHPVSDATRQLAPVAEALQQKPAPPAITRRATRQQLANQQAGQYSSSGLLHGYNPSSINEHCQIAYSPITSPLGGRHAGSFRAWAFSIYNNIAVDDTKRKSTEALTDLHPYLAEGTGLIPTLEPKTLLRLGDETQYDTYSPEDTTQGRDARLNDAINNLLKSPVKTLEEVERDYGGEYAPPTTDINDEDSFIEQITCRSPAKPVSRIEDSVEALDKLEDAIDALDQAALVEHIVSPEKARVNIRREKASVPRDSLALQHRTRSSHDALAQATHHSKSSKQKPQPPGYTSMRVKSTQPKQLSSLKRASSMTFHPVMAETKDPSEGPKRGESATKASTKRPVSLLPPKQPARPTKPPTRPTFELPGEAISRRLKEQRKARVAQREANNNAAQTKPVVVPKVIRPSKPPTVPTFELPGEAISRRKREAHEARLKAQEEEERKRREFKAKPVRKSIVPDFIPRDTIASRARQSIVNFDYMEPSESLAAKRNCVASARRVSQQLHHQPNMLAPRAPETKAQLTRKPSTMSGPPMQRTVFDKEVQIQRQRAKEIYNRDARLTEDMERDKLEREAAAKRAREEAAERGRQASREWAEKQKMKKLAGAGNGATSGRSPARQVGLKR